MSQVCVCVCERESEREKEREKETEWIIYTYMYVYTREQFDWGRDAGRFVASRTMRKKNRKINIYIYVYIYMCLYVYICIYMYVCITYIYTCNKNMCISMRACDWWCDPGRCVSNWYEQLV